MDIARALIVRAAVAPPPSGPEVRVPLQVYASHLILPPNPAAESAAELIVG
jgi:hypothetical protein